jgi:hypothetical protein
MKHFLLIITLLLFCGNGFAQRANPPIPAPRIPTSPGWEPPELPNMIPRTSNPDEIGKWWKSLSEEQKALFINSGIGVPSSYEYKELLVLNTILSEFDHLPKLAKAGDLTSRLEIQTSVDNLLNEVETQKLSVQKVNALKSIQSDFRTLYCQLNGVSKFLNTVNTTEPSTNFAIMGYKNTPEFPRSVDEPFNRFIPVGSATSVVNERLKLELVWNVNGWQRWYYNYNKLMNVLQSNQMNLDSFDSIQQKIPKWMKSADVRQIIERREDYKKQIAEISILLPDIYINSNIAINRAKASLNKAMPLVGMRKSELLDALEKEQTILAKELQESSDKLNQPKSEVDAMTQFEKTLKNTVDGTQARLNEIHRLIGEKQVSITNYQKRIVTIQAELEKQSSDLDKLRIIKFDCGRLTEDVCIQSKAYLEFELKRIDDLQNSVTKLESMGKELLDIERLMFLDSSDLENYQNEKLVKFEEFRVNNEKYVLAQKDLFEKSKVFDILNGNFNTIKAKYAESLKDSENLKNANIISSEMKLVDVPNGFEKCS